MMGASVESRERGRNLATTWEETLSGQTGEVLGKHIESKYLGRKLGLRTCLLTPPQFGGSPIKVGEEEYSLFRDYELLAKINE
jgi:hypothetical protein